MQSVYQAFCFSLGDLGCADYAAHGRFSPMQVKIVLGGPRRQWMTACKAARVAKGLLPTGYEGDVSCLKCEKQFMSKDKRSNRICPSCTRSYDWIEGENEFD